MIWLVVGGLLLLGATTWAVLGGSGGAPSVARTRLGGALIGLSLVVAVAGVIYGALVSG